MNMISGNPMTPRARRWYTIAMFAVGLAAMTGPTGEAAERVALGEYFTAVW